MKTFHSFSFSCLLLLIVCLFPACDKDLIPGCDTVVSGNQFLKVVNKSGDKIFVNMIDAIGVGAHVRSGACELYGFPKGSHTVTIDNEDGPGSRDVGFTLGAGETFEVLVNKGFF